MAVYIEPFNQGCYPTKKLAPLAQETNFSTKVTPLIYRDDRYMTEHFVNTFIALD